MISKARYQNKMNPVFVQTFKRCYSVLTVKYPTPKARMSVTLVTVTDTPACSIVSPSLSGNGRLAMLGSLWMLYQQAMMTNMSSIPIPSECKGSSL